VAEEPATRATQVEERAFWMMRDIRQADVVRDMCNKNAELVSLIEANNTGPE
jgi:hypothetical protein